jgi:hypothetical protein
MKEESYIFSLRLKNIGQSQTALITIELDRNKTIIQARGLNNRVANAEEMMIIQSWAKEKSLLISL